MSSMLVTILVFLLMSVGMFLSKTGLLAVAGGNNMHRIGLSTPRRGLIAMAVGIAIFSITITM